MTIEEWAERVDALLAEHGAGLAAHASGMEVTEAMHARGVAKLQPGDPVWQHAGRAAAVWIAADDATLRASFVPRDRTDAAAPDEELSRLKMYVRSDVGAREAACDIAAFLTAP
ncbi:MAG: hypothetical protein QOI11_883 [Candidatus Eremiobacteraeota bacterium]|jgi:hypothetical protein|nr:hypothetical protein [Candidatus Eremiobacteraeota bacterium]